jgi:hypothetical protein
MIAMTFDYREQNAIDFRRIDRSLRRNLLISMKVFGNKAVRRLRKIMRSGKFAENSPPWKAAKGGGKVLYHTGHTSTTLESDVLPGVGDIYVTVKVGWLKPEPHPERQTKGTIQDIIAFHQKEQSWEPSWSSAKAFWAQVPSEWKKTNPPMFKGVFESPKRDFMTTAKNDVELQGSFLHYVKYASERALKGK